MPLRRVLAITAPLDPAEVGTAINASADFTDPGILDTHTQLLPPEKYPIPNALHLQLDTEGLGGRA